MHVYVPACVSRIQLGSFQTHTRMHTSTHVTSPVEENHNIRCIYCKGTAMEVTAERRIMKCECTCLCVTHGLVRPDRQEVDEGIEYVKQLNCK